MITERTKAILLFTAYFAKEQDKINKPLSLTEWNRLGKWLQVKTIGPEAFLSENSASLIESWNDQTISRNRLAGLLERKTALALALDKWTRAGVWVISRGDQNYPKAFKEKLKAQAPNILFGIGSQELLSRKYIGVVGSRNASDSELQITREIGKRAFKQGFGIVSGGAKGVDEAAMTGVLEAGGCSIGFLADSLLKKSTSGIFRNFIIQNKLVLLTPFNPEAGFNAGNAMSRNKLIYALSDATIVMVSDTKGGTWEGARENIKNNWSPTFVWPSAAKGNTEIVRLGGKWLDQKLNFDSSSLNKKNSHSDQEHTLFPRVNSELSEQHTADIKLLNKPNLKTEGLFEIFIYQWFLNFNQTPVTEQELSERLGLLVNQVELWLVEACDKEYSLISEDNKTWYLIIRF